jgi:hypothetical protein
MVGSWRPPNSEVHGLVLHGLAVRSVAAFMHSHDVALQGCAAPFFWDSDLAQSDP